MTVKINGVTVNEAFDVWPAAGKILLQNEGSEIYYRNWRLSPLDTNESWKESSHVRPASRICRYLAPRVPSVAVPRPPPWGCRP